jgi:hypothetical protein
MQKYTGDNEGPQSGCFTTIFAIFDHFASYPCIFLVNPTEGIHKHIPGYNLSDSGSLTKNP